MSTIARKLRETPTYDIDLTIPLQMPKNYKEQSDDCFAQLWDLNSDDCAVCADSEVCSILFRDNKVKNKIKEVTVMENPFLDETDFDALDREQILFQIDINSGDMKVEDLVNFIKKQANTADDVAVVAYIKRLIKETGKVYTKAGIVYHRDRDAKK